MSAITWLRVEGDRLIRADLITELDLWGPSVEHGAVVAGQEARIIAFVGADRDHWAEVARVTKCEWGGDLITSLASALARAADSAEAVRYVYGLYEGGALIGWSSGPVIPVSDPRVRPLHTVADPAPGKWLRYSAGQGRPSNLAAASSS
ncbi:hypothetical protein AB0952_09215 [Streptomyces caniferus]|uniref:hypothetical protein n=1 Tax=Streptomyces caniferus TaxID=285557 RepID=UPI003456143D